MTEVVIPVSDAPCYALSVPIMVGLHCFSCFRCRGDSLSLILISPFFCSFGVVKAVFHRRPQSTKVVSTMLDAPYCTLSVLIVVGHHCFSCLRCRRDNLPLILMSSVWCSFGVVKAVGQRRPLVSSALH